MRTLLLVMMMPVLFAATLLGGRKVVDVFFEPSPGVIASHEAVLRLVKDGLRLLRDKHGTQEPDGSWGDVDTSVYEHLIKTLRREGGCP